MGIVTGKTKRIEAPDGSGTIDIRALGFGMLETAQTKRIEKLASTMKILGDLNLPASSGNGAAQEDRVGGYDLFTLLEAGITSWSYGDKVDVNQLDEPTAKWAAREILDYSSPDEAEVGKALSRFTSTSATPSGGLPRTNGS
jgi:hypothetical protein